MYEYFRISAEDLGKDAKIPLVKLGDSGEVFYEMALEMGTPGGRIKVGENEYLDWSYWRTDEYLEDYIAKLRQLKVPSNTDARIRNMIRDNMSGYLEGGASLEDTMDAIDSALSVYLSE